MLCVLFDKSVPESEWLIRIRMLNENQNIEVTCSEIDFTGPVETT